MDFDIYIENDTEWVKLPNVSSYTVGWYDVSKDSGRDTTTADGKMILNVISDKYRLDITTTYMSNAELANFFSIIKKAPTMMVKYYNPYLAQVVTKEMYRGDRTAQLRFSDESHAQFEPTTIALIEL